MVVTAPGRELIGLHERSFRQVRPFLCKVDQSVSRSSQHFPLSCRNLTGIPKENMDTEVRVIADVENDRNGDDDSASPSFERSMN